MVSIRRLHGLLHLCVSLLLASAVPDVSFSDNANVIGLACRVVCRLTVSGWIRLSGDTWKMTAAAERRENAKGGESGEEV